MTPFGEKMRALRKRDGVTQKEMAAATGISSAYLPAPENGHRGRPSWYLTQHIITYFNLIWDEAEEIQRLAQISHPRIVIDTAGLSPHATELANKLAGSIAHMDDEKIQSLLDQVSKE